MSDRAPLRAYYDGKAVQAKSDKQYAQRTAQLGALENTMIDGFNAVIKTSTRTTKTEVVNHPKSISTPDVQRVVEAVDALPEKLKKNNVDVQKVAVENLNLDKLSEAISSLSKVEGKKGNDGKDGNDGSDGKDGADGRDGKDGRPVKLRSNDTHIQYQYDGDIIWKNLVSLVSLRGRDGYTPVKGVDYFDAIGKDGNDAKELELRKTKTQLQWRHAGGKWQILAKLSELKGDAAKHVGGGGGGPGIVKAVIAGTGISIDSTDVYNPIISTTGGGGMADPGANGMVVRTDVDTTTARTITGTTNQITVTNGNGVSGNPTLSLPQDIHTGASPTFGGLKVDETMYKSKEFIASTIITFVADDGPATDFTLLKPLFDSYGYKFTTAVIANNIGTAGYMSSSQIQQLYAEGHEIASHALTHTYPGLGSLTEAEQLVEIRDSQAAINNLGVDCNNIAYPFGSANHITKELSRQYYRSGRRFHHVGLNPMPLHTFDLRTISLGAWFETPNATYPVTDTYIDYYKTWVDAAVASKQWLIFTLHSGTVGFDAIQQGYLVDTLNYIQSLGIPVKTLDQALDHFGNLVDVERYNTSGTSSRFAVGADGSTINTGDSSAIGRIGVGVNPSSPVHVASSGATSSTRDIYVDRYKSDDVAPYINTRKARGTLEAPAAILVNDNTLGLFSSGHDGTAFGPNTAAMRFTAAENFTPTAQGTYFTLGTTPIGTTTRATRLKIAHDGEAMFTQSSSLASGYSKSMSVTPTITQTGTSGHTTLYVNPTMTTVGSGANVLLDVGANAESYIMAKYGAASSITGGRGWLNITNPSSDAAGAGILFSSTSTPWVGSLQLDNTGNMVFRNRTNTNANVYIDTNTDVIFRTGTTSATTLLTLKSSGYVGIATTAPNYSLTLGSTATGISLNNQVDQTTNFERLRIFKAGNIFNIASESGGTGTNRSITISTANASGVAIQTLASGSTYNAVSNMTVPYMAANAYATLRLGKVLSDSNAVEMNYQHAGDGLYTNNFFMGLHTNTQIIGFDGYGQVTLAKSSRFNASSGVQSAVKVTPTLNQTSTAGYTALLINPTETAVGSGAKNLIDAQVGGVSKWKVRNDGVELPVQATTASAPAYVKGGIYFDTTLNKLRVGGATAWETITSS